VLPELPVDRLGVRGGSIRPDSVADTIGRDVVDPMEQLDIDEATESVRVNCTFRDAVSTDGVTVPYDVSRLGEHFRQRPSIHSPSSVRGFFEIHNGLIRERRMHVSNTGTLGHVKQ
jgi:hypothetical protein